MVAGTRGQGSRGRGGRRRGDRGSSRDVTTGFTPDVLTLHSPTPTPKLSLPTPDSPSPTLDSRAPLEVRSVSFITSPMVAGTRGQGSRGRGGRRRGGRGSSRDVTTGFTPDVLTLHSPTPTPNLSLPTSDSPSPTLDSRAPLEVRSVSFITSPMVAGTRGQRSRSRGGRRRGGRGSSRDVTTGFAPELLTLRSSTQIPNLSLPTPDSPSPTLDSQAPLEVGSVPFITSQMVAGTRGRGGRGRGGRRRGGRGSSRDVTTGFTLDLPTLHSPIPTPNLSLPIPDSPSHTLDSRAPLEVGASSTRPSSTSTGSSMQERGPRRAYLSKNIPTNPAERKVIHIDGLNYMEQDVVRTMTKDFKAHFYGKQTQWHLLDKALVERLYRSFQDRYQYETAVDPGIARRVWEERSKLRCRGTWTSVRSACNKKTGSTNPADWKECCPNFLHQEDWEGILKSWMTEKWKRLSRAGTKNRQKVPGEEEGSCSYVRHTGGSVNFGIHRKRLEIELGKKPTQIELFRRLHKREKGKGEWCDARAEKAVEKYQEKMREKRVLESESVNDCEQSSEVPFDPQAWVEAIGVPKNNHVYGFGLTEEAESILNHTLASSSSKRPRCYKDLETHIQAQVDARLDSRIEALRAEMNEKMQQQIQEMLANLQHITSRTLSIGRAKDRT